MDLVEIFYSIQGESTFSGLPCIFIRLAKCNLRCSYCDSTYTFETRFKLDIDEIIEDIGQYSPVKLVEITGGEPLLQEKVYELIEALHQNEYQILLETNGSISLENVPKYVHKIVDIKTPGSGYSNSFLDKNLKFINQNKDEIKFVITSREDYEFSRKKIEQFLLNNHKILFSPVISSIDAKTLVRWILDDKLSVRFQLQIHKYIWDVNTQGV
jgi:7-carboxy-7-deazaguanine synthase